MKYTYSISKIAALLLLPLALIGCGKKMVMSPPPAPAPDETILASDSPQESLFKGDQAVLSDQDIVRILGTQIKLADRHRLAVLNLNSTYLWSEDAADAEAKNFANLMQALKASPQLTEVHFLPSLLVPEKRTVPYLREAAARIQADLLLVYISRIQTFQQDRFLKANNEVHAQCVVESVLIDVRTGIVLDTTRATEQISLKKTPADLNFNETVSRAESEARGKAILSTANSVVTDLAALAK